jgi:hypothetical protein
MKWVSKTYWHFWTTDRWYRITKAFPHYCTEFLSCTVNMQKIKFQTKMFMIYFF